MDEQACLHWLEWHLHPNGWVCPHCGSPDRRFFRKPAFPAYRCRACDGYYTLVTNTVFEGTRQTPAMVVLILSGVAKGETTARLSRELGLDRKRLGEIRQQLQHNLYETLPTERMEGTEFEADELYQNAGEKSQPHLDPLDPPWQRANKRRGRGTYENDRPPVIGVVSRDTGEYRYWVGEHADRETSRQIVQASLALEGTLFFTDEASNHTGVHPQHRTVCHGQCEWARDDDGDWRREVHCNSCEGAGAALRTYLRVFRGVHKFYLAEYVATVETMTNTKRICPPVVIRMCFGDSLHATTS